MTPETLFLLLRLSFFTLLYLGLGLIALIVWREIRAPAGAAPPAWLVLAQGPADLRPGTQFAVRAETVIGRAPGSTILLPDTFVSARHARIVWRDGRWWIEDLGSTNGTFVDEQPVTRAVPLHPGATVRVGQTVLTFAVSA